MRLRKHPAVTRITILLAGAAVALALGACEKGTRRAATRAWQDLAIRPPLDGARAVMVEDFVRAYPEPKTNPYLPRACVLIADHHAAEGRLDIAASWYERAIRADPDDPDLLNALGYFYARHRTNLDRSILLLETAIRLAEERGYPPRRIGLIKDSLGWSYRMRGDLPQAVALLEEACRLAPGVPVLQEHLADAYRAIGELTRAADLYLDLLGRGAGNGAEIRAALEGIARDADPALKATIMRRLHGGAELVVPGRPN
jgi:tetratricopeptide (TPR) repeat protein